MASILRTVVWEICCPEGTHRTLSRRDWMIVARQFIAWNTPKRGEPSRRDGVSWATPHIRRPWSKNVLSTESYRSLRDGFFVWHTPGNKLPGYDHSVPPGQRLSTPVHEFAARSLHPSRPPSRTRTKSWAATIPIRLTLKKQHATVALRTPQYSITPLLLELFS